MTKIITTVLNVYKHLSGNLREERELTDRQRERETDREREERRERLRKG